MRARQRHLNPRDAGAQAVYDARFLTGASGSAVSDWTDRSRSGYTASQATGSKQPSLEYSVQGGSNVVRFDGAGDELLTTSYALPSAASLISVAKADAWQQASKYRPIATHAYNPATSLNRGLGFGYIAPGSFSDWLQYDILFIGSGYQNTSPPRAIGPIDSGSDFRIISATLGSTVARGWSNGVKVTTRVESTGTIQARTEQFAIGAQKGTADDFWDGDIGCLSYFHTEISESLRKRIEHSGGFAWKIACS
jgi:hypothetical protein